MIFAVLANILADAANKRSNGRTVVAPNRRDKMPRLNVFVAEEEKGTEDMSRKRFNELDDLILNCLESNTMLTCPGIARILSSGDQNPDNACQTAGGKHWSVRTIGKHLNDLIEDGKVEHQDQGFIIKRDWREGQPKAFILVELATSKTKGENYQKMLIDVIRESFRKAEHQGLRLISVDAVLGAEFSVIVQVYSDDLHYIGRFVKAYLLTSDLVKMTRTIMVWPTDPRE